MFRRLASPSLFLALSLLAPAPGAQAAEPIVLSLGGRLKEFFYVADQKNTPTERLSATGMFDDARVAFQGRTVLDNGVTVRAFVRIYALERNQRTLDEGFVEVGSGLGKLRAGERDGVNRDLLGDPTPEAFLTADEEVVEQALKPRTGITMRDAFTFKRFTGNHLGVSYQSPEIAGFKLGVAYHPELSPNAGGSFIDKALVANNGVDVSAAFSGDYPGGTYRIGAGFFHSKRGSLTGIDGNKAWNVTAGATYGGWELSGGYINVMPTSGLDESSWTIGALYAIGPFKVSANYFKGQRDTVPGGGGRTEQVQRETIQGAYKLAPGVTLGVTGFHADQTDASGVSYDGTGLITGIKLQF